MKMRCVGKGVYHAGPGGIERLGDFGWRIDGDQVQIALFCPKFGVCLQRVHLAEPDAKTATWKWDGNWETPTIQPSIGCEIPPRCGQHMSIAAGEIQLA